MSNQSSELDQKRHSLAHLLAAAVLTARPEAKPTIGPAVDNGFYYDFDFGNNPISETDLKDIQKQMRKTLPSWTEFTHEEVSAEVARERFKNNSYKLELIDEIVAKGEPITLYTAGEFTDLCRGGHTENPAQDIDAKAFKLERVAGAYWRGDETKPMLTRIYGLAFDTPEELAAYETQREEAKKRDHRKLGAELDLFTFSDLVGAGLPLFTPKGTLLRNLIIEKIYSLQAEYNYQPVWIPHITKKELYETSGHWEKFGDELFKVRGQSDVEFVMKPMNCPHHTQIYASSPKSYRDLPVRYAEATTNYRDEQAGELLGLSRVRSLTQDDGHIFCMPEQIEQEANIIVSVIRQFYQSLDMMKEGDYWVSLSVRDPKTPEKYIGEASVWDKSEQILEDIAKREKLNYQRVEGEAAFYGPKLDFMFKDALGREWQLATLQLDFNMPARFGLEYTDRDGIKKTPVMIHRAIAGSLERFLSVVIEHFAGAFPLWLAPVQVKILPIGEAHQEYAAQVTKDLKLAGVRVELDDSAESLGKRIRNAKLAKTPYFLVIGDKEVESNTVTLESRDTEASTNISLAELKEKLAAEVK
jgi:threonyl-tRNA synthetase